MTGKDAQQAPTGMSRLRSPGPPPNKVIVVVKLPKNPFLLDPPSNDCSANSNPIALR